MLFTYCNFFPYFIHNMVSALYELDANNFFEFSMLVMEMTMQIFILSFFYSFLEET